MFQLVIAVTALGAGISIFLHLSGVGVSTFHPRHKGTKAQTKRRRPPLTAIVHVGPHKTGSTAIQSSLRENADYFMDDELVLIART